ncbi:MAG TPA: dihydrolipoyl dehydrogenase [Thermoplasmata archaeon]|nr:dihydrolipoyl dehydrogenase [Thermoplasmata archaeon]
MAGTYARKAELLVVGGGPAGYMGAIRAGQLGKKVVLVERRDLGGECLNRGCIPSKALIHASLLYDAVRNEGPEVGVIAPDARFDLAATMRWKQAVVAKERQGVATLLKAAGVAVLPGEARFTGPHSADVTAPDGGHERVDFDGALIATGAVHASLPGFETDGRQVVNAWDLLELDSLPRSMLILGGGVSGCELGEFLARVGVAVTIVELMPQILPGIDPELARELASTLGRLGVGLRVATRATGLARSADSVELTVEGAQGTERLTAERLFVTVGKRPASRELGLEDAGVAADPKTGFIGVDAQLRTNVPHIFAAGDVARPPMLAHKSYREGIVAAEAFAGRATRFDFRAMPSVVFTTPELATVGWTKAEAAANGMAARDARFPYAALGRAHASHATGGWLKIVGDDGTGRLLGVQAAGEDAGGFVSEAALALEMGATVRDVALTIHPHPTFSEALGEAALLWLGEPMHVAQRRLDARGP